MADHTIVCPACARKLRVPEEQMGQVVQCPLCRVVFTAPPRPVSSITATKPEPPPKKSERSEEAIRSEKPAEEPKPRSEEVPSKTGVSDGGAITADPEPMLDVRRMLLLPGLGLVICGILGAIHLVNALNEIWASGPEGMNKSLDSMPLKNWVVAPPSPEVVYFGTLFIGVVFLLISLGMVVGGIQILRLRTYWLAIAGSILGMLNLSFCFSAPLGVWSLMVLRLPEVRSAFEAMTGDEPKDPEP
jgi:hypothetical protein